MQNYWNNISQPVNYQNRPVKKEEKNEKLKKAVTYTLGTLAGVGAAALIGYGIINKNSQGKKVVDKAKDAVSEVAKKGKDSTKKSSSQINNLTFQCLNKIINNQDLTQDEIRSEINILTLYRATCEIPQVNQQISKYINLLQKVLKENSDSSSIEATKYKKICSKEINNIDIGKVLELTKQEDILIKELEKNNLSFDNLKLDNDNTISKYNIKIQTFKEKKLPKNSIQLRDNIYYDKAKNDIYICKNTEYYKVKVQTLENLNPYIKRNDVTYLKQSSKVGFIKQDAQIVDSQPSGKTKFIKGVDVKENTNSGDVYIDVQDLSKDDIVFIANKEIIETNKNKILEAIRDYCAAETIGQVLAEDALKDKLVDNDGKTTEAGKILITDWVDKNKTDKDKIAAALQNINNFDDKSVGAAFVSAIKEKCAAETIGQVLAEDALKDKLVDNDGKTTEAGKILITDWVDKNKTDKDKIAAALKKIDDFSEKSVGAAFVSAIKDYCKPEIIGQVLAEDALKDKLVDNDGKTTDAGNILITGWVDKNKADNGKIVAVLEAIKDFGKNSVGAAFANAIKENCGGETIGKVLVDDALKDKLVDKTTGTPTDVGKILITGWVDKNKTDNGNIAAVLNQIKNFDDKSVGAAFVSAIKDNCNGETIKNILSGLFESKPDMEIDANTKEQRLLDILFTKINLIEFKNFIKENKIKTYKLQDEQYKESVEVKNNKFEIKIKTYTKAYFTSKGGNYNDSPSAFDKYLLIKCGVTDTSTLNGKSYAEIATTINTDEDVLQEIKLSVDDYENNELVDTDNNLTDKAKDIILRHSTGDNDLDSLDFKKVIQNSEQFKSEKNKRTITIGGEEFEYCCKSDTLYIKHKENTAMS